MMQVWILMILMIFYDLDKIFPQIQADLEKRRENKSK